jgi:transcriptional regulator with XRE-family HTH domain
MTPGQLRRMRGRLGLTQRQLGIVARVNRDPDNAERQIRRYENGAYPVPGPLSAVVEALIDGWRPTSTTTKDDAK